MSHILTSLHVLVFKSASRFVCWTHTEDDILKGKLLISLQ